MSVYYKLSVFFFSFQFLTPCAKPTISTHIYIYIFIIIMIVCLTYALCFLLLFSVLDAMRKANVQPTAASYFKIINGAFRHDDAHVRY